MDEQALVDSLRALRDAIWALAQTQSHDLRVALEEELATVDEAIAGTGR